MGTWFIVYEFKPSYKYTKMRDRERELENSYKNCVFKLEKIIQIKMTKLVTSIVTKVGDYCDKSGRLL